jgi:hypothetical protein
MWNHMHAFEEARQLVAILEQFLAAAKEYMAIMGDKCFRDALFIYDNLKMQTKNKTQGAAALFNLLNDFFRKRRKPGEEEPTVKEIERDVRKLLLGHADGEVVVKNKRPELIRRKREVIDAVHTDKIKVKESVDANIDEN